MPNADAYLVQIQRCDNAPNAGSNPIGTPNTKLNGQATPAPSSPAPAKVQLTSTTAQGLNASTIQQQIANKINPKIVVQQPQIKIVQQKSTSNIVQQTPTAPQSQQPQQQQQQIVINNAGTVQQSTTANQQQTSTTQMSGMAALAAAACATQKIQGRFCQRVSLTVVADRLDLTQSHSFPD